jgi:ABC-2 type transport system permease protein
MRHLIVITRNELRDNFGQPSVWIMTLAVPVLMAILLGVGLTETSGDVTLTLDLIDLDQSTLSSRLVATLNKVSDPDELRICFLNGDDALPDECDFSVDDAPDAWEEVVTQRLEDEDSYAAVIIPAGFDAQLRAGEEAAVVYRANDNLNAPQVIKQTVNAAIDRAGGTVAVAQLVTSVGSADLSFDAVYTDAEAAWQSPPAVLAVSTTEGEEDGEGSGFTQSVPGMACMFVMINVLGVAQSVMRSRQFWTFQRLMVMPVRRWMIVGGKLMAYYLIGLGQFGLILLVGAFVGIDYGGAPLGVIAVMLIYTLAVSAMALFLATLVRSEGQASGITMLVSLTLSPLGGAWWPLNIVPEWMQAVGHIVSPVSWAMDAFHGMLWNNEVLVDILPSLGVLLLWAVVFFALGVWRFRYE